MSWIAKNPRPFDFCGHPGCPICFDWVEENGVGMSMTGEEKWKQDMLGAKDALVTVEFLQAMTNFHRLRVSEIANPPDLPPDRMAEIEERSVEIVVGAVIRQQMVERRRPTAKVMNMRNLDDMESSKLEEAVYKEQYRNAVRSDTILGVPVAAAKRFQKNYRAKYGSRRPVPPLEWFARKIAEEPGREWELANKLQRVDMNLRELAESVGVKK